MAAGGRAADVQSIINQSSIKAKGESENESCLYVYRLPRRGGRGTVRLGALGLARACRDHCGSGGRLRVCGQQKGREG